VPLYGLLMEQVSSREVYRNAWMSVREDVVRRGDGSVGLYGVVDKTDFAVIIPRDERGLWLVEQYRYPVRRRAWEFPQGSWTAPATGSAAALAAAELREETGLRADQLRHLGHLHGGYGFSSQGFDVFVATGLTAGPPEREPTESDMVTRQVTAAEFTRMVAAGAVIDSATLAAYGLLRLSDDADQTS